MYFRMMRVGNETNRRVEELGREFEQDYYTYRTVHEAACELCVRLDDKNTWVIGRTCPLRVILDKRYILERK